MAIFMILILFGLVEICIGSCMWLEGVDSIWTPVLSIVGLLMFGIGIASIAVFF